MAVNDGRQKQFSLKQKFLYTPIGARWENDGQCIEQASTMNECHLIFTKQAQLVAQPASALALLVCLEKC